MPATRNTFPMEPSNADCTSSRSLMRAPYDSIVVQSVLNPPKKDPTKNMTILNPKTDDMITNPMIPAMN